MSRSHPGKDLRRSNHLQSGGRSSGLDRLMTGVILGSILLAGGVIAASAQDAAASTLVVPLGAAIEGKAAWELSGSSVSLSADGSRVAVASPGAHGGGITGHVRVHEWDGSTWVQMGDDITSDVVDEDQSSSRISLSSDGSRVAIGSSSSDPSGRTRAGRVRVYGWNGSEWVQVGLDIDGETAGDRSGASVSLSRDGSWVAVGAPMNGGGRSEAGSVRIHRWDGSAWVQVGPDIQGEDAGDRSGEAVSLTVDGLRVAIGAPLNSEAAFAAGHVRVYDWDGSAWVQVGDDIDGKEHAEFSGGSVSLSADGSRLALGAAMNGSFAPAAGQVRVYGWDGSAWSQLGSDIDGEAADDLSGVSVSLSADGSRVAIGAPYNDGVGQEGAGHVRLYGWDGFAWFQLGADIDGQTAGDFSGASVSLSADGSRLAIGAPLSSGTGLAAGHVRIYSIAASWLSPEGQERRLAVDCAVTSLQVRASVRCTVTGGDPGVEILWRAAYNPVFAEAGVTLDDSGTGKFSFVVPAAALGEELTVELVEWLEPVSLGVVGGPVPGSVPAGEGPVPVWPIVLVALAVVALMRRRILVKG